MTGYSDITYEWLNPAGTLTHSLTWLFCLAAAISKPDPYHVVPSTESKKLSALSGHKRSEVWCGFCISMVKEPQNSQVQGSMRHDAVLTRSNKNAFILSLSFI
jgi:hypothetical protein